MTFDEVLDKAKKHFESIKSVPERFSFHVSLVLRDKSHVQLRECFVEHGPEYTTVYSKILLIPFICLTEDIVVFTSEPEV